MLNPSNRTATSALALVPRQVMMIDSKSKNKKSKTSNSDNESKSNSRHLLLNAIASFLESNGFDKTLAKFRSEAQFESDSKASTLNLEELVCKFLESSTGDEEVAINGLNDKDVEIDTTQKDELNVEVKDKKKEKKSLPVPIEEKPDKDKLEINGGIAKDSEHNVEVKDKKKKKEKKSLPVPVEEKSDKDRLEISGGIAKDSAKDSILPNNEENGKEKKKKKKHKENSDTCDDNIETAELNVNDKGEKREKKHKAISDTCDDNTETAELKENDIGEKKKKRKNKTEVSVATNGLAENGNENTEENLEDSKPIDNKLEALGNDDIAEKKSHKKRKRLESEEKEDKPLDDNDDTTIAKKSKNKKSNESNEDNEMEAGTTPKSKKKEKRSSEPKTVNAFQRVKVEEVKFANEKLQDNSYWALDDTGSGYGAKAQEVLGQVRGRDFRHEKTKKKRGSYRGGQIDLQSHSVKFNYSDEE